MILKLEKKKLCPYILGRIQLEDSCTNCCYNRSNVTCEYECYSDKHHDATREVSASAFVYITKHPEDFPAYTKYQERKRQAEIESANSSKK